jgi:hypothetical protein
VAFRDVTPERMRRPLCVLVVNWRKISITLIEGMTVKNAKTACLPKSCQAP